MRAVKGNKEYIIDESQQKSYQGAGFDILDEDSKVIAYGRGKTVPYDDYMKSVEEIDRLHERIAQLEAVKELVKKAESKKAGE